MVDMEELNALSERVIGLAIQVHRELGPAEREEKQLKIRLGKKKQKKCREILEKIKISGFFVILSVLCVQKVLTIFNF